MRIRSIQFGTLLVFVVIFGTVAPAGVAAQDTVYINNTVTSESYSGGYSSAGSPGQSGEDGAPGSSGQDGTSGSNGEDGLDGRNGSSGASGSDGKSIYGESSAAVQSTTIVDGFVVSSTSIQSTTTDHAITEASTSITHAEDVVLSEDKPSTGNALVTLLQKLRTLLATYVSSLF